MEKETIEAIDKTFREIKLKRLRTSLARRQLELKGDRRDRNRRRFKTMIPLLMALAMAIFFAGKAMRSHELVSESISNKAQTDRNEYAFPIVRTEPSGTFAETGKPVGDLPDAPPADSANAKIPPFESEAENKGVPLEMEGTANFEVSGEVSSINPTSTPASPVEDLSGEISESAEDGFMESQEPESAEPAPSLPSCDISPPPYGTRIARILVCSGVEDRKCVVPLSRFALEESQNPHLLMEVYSDSVPYVLKHVYYHEGRKYIEIPLEIEHRRMRTWSRIALLNRGQIGSWTVEIEAGDGTVLGRAEFQVLAE